MSIDENEHAVPDMPGWVFVGQNPRHVRYFDDDHEAMDITNWDVLVGGFDADAVGTSDADADDPAVTWIEAAANSLTTYGMFGQVAYHFADVIIVREGSAEHEHYRACLASLADYPLLDESGYSELDYEAWQRCWRDYARRDIATRVADDIAADMAYGDDAADDITSALEDVDDEWERVAGEAMSHYSGLTGDYDEDGAVEAVSAWARTGRGLATILAAMPARCEYRYVAMRYGWEA